MLAPPSLRCGLDYQRIGGAVTNAIGNASTGIGLNITARVTPSGVVTMIINQHVSDPQATDPALTKFLSFLCDQVHHYAGDGSGRRHHRHRGSDPGKYHLHPFGNTGAGSNTGIWGVIWLPLLPKGAD